MSGGGGRSRFAWAGAIAQDVRHAWRMIIRMPGLAIVVVASLAIGIGVNVAVYSWVQAVGFRPLPGVSDAKSYFVVDVVTSAGHSAATSWPEYTDLREGIRSFQELIAYRMVPLTIGEAQASERAYGMLVSANYFTALGLRPAAGRLINDGDLSRAGSEPVAVISWDLWRTRFDGAPGIVGQRVVVNDRPLTIAGVAPRGFQGTILGLTFDMWIPATAAPVVFGGSREIDDRAMRSYTMIAKLAPGATIASAQADVDATMQRLAAIYPQTNATIIAKVLAFWDAPRGPQRLFIRALSILQGVVLLLLLAVCGNTANLVLARASTRRREIGIRLAVGASRRRVGALLLTENVVLALIAGALGTMIAMWLTRALSAMPITGALPVRFAADVDLGGLAIAIGLAVACGIAFGLPAALQLARVDPDRMLRGSGDVAGRSMLRNLLMGAEVALAVMVLLVGALFFRSFSDTRTTDPGFRREGVLLAAYDLSGRGKDAAATRMLAATLLDRLRALPGVEAAAIANAIPLDIHGLPMRSFTLEGRARTDGVVDLAVTNTVTPGYFETMQIPLRAGADFVALTDPATAPQAIVNEEFVRQFIGHAEPLGRRIESNGRTYTIAGVVRNSLYDAFGEPPKPIIYLSYRDRNVAVAQLHLRTRPGAELLLATDVRRIVRELEPSLPIYDVRTLSDHVDRNLFLRKVPARLFSVLGPLLLALAAAGIYAVVAYSVSQRRNEIGLRLALGASPRRVVAQLLEESLGVIAIGVAAGWVIAFAVYRQMARGTPLDIMVFGGVPALLLLVAVLASWVPARRATRIDPMAALRPE